MTTFKWEVGCMYYLFKPYPIISPPFYIEPSRTFEFYMKLYPLGRCTLNKLILVLWRCDNNEKSIKLTYDLEIHTTTGEIQANYASTGRYTFNFQRPMQFPDSEVFLTRTISHCGPVLKITCKIINIEIDNFQAMDEEVMRELSSHYESLLEHNIYYPFWVHSSDRYFCVYKAILQSRCEALYDYLYTGVTVNPTVLQSIVRFLYTGKLTTLTTNMIPVLMNFRSSLLETMHPFKISEYSAQTFIQGNRYTFEWVIENFRNVRYENIFSYVVVAGDTVIKLSLIPHRENSFSIEMFGSEDFFIKGKVDIIVNNTFVTLVEMSNSETNISVLVVNNTWSINRVLESFPHLINSPLRLKISVNMCSRNAGYTSNVNEISHTNISTDIMHMYKLGEDFEQLFKNCRYYDFTIIVNNSESDPEYERYHTDYTRFQADNRRFHADYASYRADYVRYNAHYQRFPTHKAILSARSSVFCAMLSHDCRENLTNEVIIRETKPYIMHAMLLFMYCGKLRYFHLEFAMDLYVAADFYNIPTLKIKCSEYLQSIISRDDFEKIYQHAVRNRDDSLKKKCITFSKKNNIEIIE